MVRLASTLHIKLCSISSTARRGMRPIRALGAFDRQHASRVTVPSGYDASPQVYYALWLSIKVLNPIFQLELASLKLVALKGFDTVMMLGGMMCSTSRAPRG